MKKVFLLSLCLFTISFLQAQTLESKSISFWKIEKVISFFNENGEQMIEMPVRFKRNKQLKKQAKLMTIDGELYQIVCERKEQLIYKKGGELVAKINRRNDEIHILENDRKYKKKYKSFKGVQYYIDENGEQVVSAELKKRKYLISTKKGGFIDQKLLMVLNLHQLLETQKKIKESNDLMLLANN